uniref:Uncharacterized protein n=1 Tax=Siphoviridae sp. ctgaU3 TaxID=2825609 RepID=A0A8S5UW22_9CAUD|nr:MAG TPA: hypothetical protein [Siphoviridae sp. ctgaU3]
MYLSVTAQNDTAALIAKWVRENTIGYGAVATEVGRAGYPDVAVVAIAEDGETTCTAKVAVHRNRIVYVSKLGAHVSYPLAFGDAGRIVGGFLSLEEG